jgi:hypothetical protein
MGSLLFLRAPLLAVYGSAGIYREAASGTARLHPRMIVEDQQGRNAIKTQCMPQRATFDRILKTNAFSLNASFCLTNKRDHLEPLLIKPSITSPLVKFSNHLPKFQ